MPNKDELKRIERKAKNGNIVELASILKEFLGARLTTYLSGRNDARDLDLWISDKEQPAPVEELRLRYGYHAAAILVSNFGAETARGAFMGMNRYLGDDAPTSWLR